MPDWEFSSEAMHNAMIGMSGLDTQSSQYLPKMISHYLKLYSYLQKNKFIKI